MGKSHARHATRNRAFVRQALSTLSRPLALDEPMTKTTQILALADRNKSVEEIAKALYVSPGYVYSILRAARPDRARKKHKTRSDKPSQIAMMHLQGKEAVAIADRLGISRAYVYRHLPRDRNGAILPPCPVPVVASK